jgi:hypothetical protein
MGRWESRDSGWDEYLLDASEFYRNWFDLHDALLRGYRGSAVEALRMVERTQSTESQRNSAQAEAFAAWIKAEVLSALGNWEEAFRAAQVGFQPSDQVVDATTFGALAAAAGGSPKALAEVLDAMAILPRDMPLHEAAVHMAQSLAHLLAERWDAGRDEYLLAHRGLKDIGNALVDARLQLAVSQLAAGRFPEADEAGREAEAFFSERGAESFVLTYRAKAFRHAVDPARGRVTAAEQVPS